MRASGAVSLPPVVVSTHVCWRFDDAAFRHAAVSYLADGLARHERVTYVTDKGVEEMRCGVSPPDCWASRP